jgi:hypothetical protein
MKRERANNALEGDLRERLRGLRRGVRKITRRVINSGGPGTKPDGINTDGALLKAVTHHPLAATAPSASATEALEVAGINLVDAGLNLITAGLNLIGVGPNLTTAGLNLITAGFNLRAAGLNLVGDGINPGAGRVTFPA